MVAGSSAQPGGTLLLVININIYSHHYPIAPLLMIF